MQEQSLQAFREAGDKRGECATLGNIGSVLVERGELLPAMQNYDQAIAIAQEIGFKAGLASSLTSSADVYLAQDRLQAARDRAQRAIALHQELGDSLRIAMSQCVVAEIAGEKEQTAEAETLVREAAPKLEQQNKSDIGSQALALLARILLVQSKIPDSKIAANRAITFSQEGSDLNSRFAAAIAGALVNAADGRMPEAVRTLENVRGDASRHGYAGFEFESRLNLGELELRSGKANAGRARLQQLQTDARNKGFLLIARKANAALNYER